MITMLDVVKYRRDEINAEAEAMKDYIAGRPGLCAPRLVATAFDELGPPPALGCGQHQLTLIVCILGLSCFALVSSIFSTPCS
jgi:hypothetical protein